MIAAVGLIGVLTGGALACAAGRYPARTAQLETIAGVLLIAGLALLGSRLPYNLHWRPAPGHIAMAAATGETAPLAAP
jgi:hypothetical protein